MTDFVLCYPPMSLPDTPLVGIALLSAILNKNGFSCKIFDMNIELYQTNIYDKDMWETSFAKYTIRSSFDSEYNKIKSFVEVYADMLISINSTYIGMGVFTKSNEYITEKLCGIIRQKSPNTKILIGGIYCDQIGPDFLARGLIDFYINGPAEDLIIDLANNNTENKPGLNNLDQGSVALNKLPYPDYSQLDLTKYKSKGLYITGSRGCPYKCTFCGVSARWTKFQLRDVTEIISEMEFLHTTYGTSNFFFTDSLVNGNMKYFRSLCSEMKKLNIKHHSTISTEWFMSIRNKFQMTPEDFDIMADIGLTTIKLGVESGSPAVLQHIKKGYKIPDLFYFLDQLDRVGVRCDLLFFTGYPTESVDDFEMSKQLLTDITKYKRIINYVRVTPMCVEEDTPIRDMGYELGATVEGITRYNEFRQLIFDLGFNIRKDQLISNLVKENSNIIFNGNKDNHESNYFARAKSK